MPFPETVFMLSGKPESFMDTLCYRNIYGDFYENGNDEHSG
jgi:hypothetical protein